MLTFKQFLQLDEDTSTQEIMIATQKAQNSQKKQALMKQIADIEQKEAQLDKRQQTVDVRKAREEKRAEQAATARAKSSTGTMSPNSNIK